MPDKKTDKIELNELLRLKREEKPDRRFWEQFDRDLHQRMLQNLVKKDPLPLRVLQTLTGRKAQGVLVFTGAAVIALFALTVMITVAPETPKGLQFVERDASARELEPAAVALSGTMSALREDVETDFAADSFSTVEVAAYNRDFDAATTLQLAAYDSSAYSGDVAFSTGEPRPRTASNLVY